MAKKKETDVEAKLRELEATITEASDSNVPANREKSSELADFTSYTSITSLDDEKNLAKADGHLLGGFLALIIGTVALFLNLRVGSSWFVGPANGFLLLLLLAGMGFFMYDYKNKIGWLLVLISLVGIVVSVIMNMRIYLHSMSMIECLIIFVPFALGAALVAKGMKIQKEIEDKQKKND